MNKEQVKVLVSGASGDVAQGVLKALERSGLEIALLTTCIHERSAFLHKNYESYISPPVDSEEYIPFLSRFLKSHGVSLFIPGVDSELMKVARNKGILEETGTRVLIGSVDSQAVCDDKFETSEFLRKNGFSTPQTCLADSVGALDFIEKIGFPLVAKVRTGRGSQGVHIVDSYDEVESFLGKSEYCLQEWIPPDEGEYTTGVYLGDDGEIKGVATLRRQLRYGSTYTCARVLAPELEAPLTQMAKCLGLKYLNIQSRLRNGILYPFEFNGRFSGTTGIITRVFNAPAMVVREWLLDELLEFENSDEVFVAMRYFDEVFATPSQIDALRQRSHSFVQSNRI